MIDIEAIKQRNEQRRARLIPLNKNDLYVSFEQFWTQSVADIDALIAEVERLTKVERQDIWKGCTIEKRDV